MVQTLGGENWFKNLEYSLCITLRLMGLIRYLWEDIKSQCDFMYLRKMFKFYYEQCIGTKLAHTLWIIHKIKGKCYQRFVKDLI